MRCFVFLYVILASNFIFSQEKINMNYYFNYSSVWTNKDYRNNITTKLLNFSNTKDTTYVNLQIKISDQTKEASILDYREKIIILFDVDFDYQNINDLNKLSNSRLKKNVVFKKPMVIKSQFEDYEFESDTTSKTKIVHIIRYTNNKFKEIRSETYYFFKKMNNINSLFEKTQKKYLVTKFNIDLNEDDNLIKIVNVTDSKIDSETNFIMMKSEDFNFDFSIDEIIDDSKKRKHN